jgi:hypothetical protein
MGRLESALERTDAMSKSRDVLMETAADTPALTRSVISAVAFDGLRIQTADGKPATLAIVDQDGRIVESGDAVLEEAWNVAILSYRRFLIGEGALRVYSGPQGVKLDKRRPESPRR